MQDFFDTIWQFYLTHQTLILTTAFSGFGITILTIIATIICKVWQSLQEKKKQKQEQKKLQQESHYARDLPFRVIPPNDNVFPKIFNREVEQYSNPVLADQNIPYQQRTEGVDHTEKLYQLIIEHKWLLIRGRSGLGKTREAGELAQRLNQEGYYVLVSSGTFENPTVEQFKNIPERKVLLVFDDLHNYMNTGWVVEGEKPDSLKSSVNQPPQEKLLEALKHCQQNIIPDEMLVLVTTRDEAESPQTDNISQKPLPSPLQKLQLDKFPQLYKCFYHYCLPEPSDEAQQRLLETVLPETTIKVRCAVEQIVRSNDNTFRNLVENLNRIDNSRNHRYLTETNFNHSLRGTWASAYEKAIRRYPLAKYIYDAVDLLQQCGVIITREMVIKTALIIARGNFWQRWGYSYRLPQILSKLEDLERILNPRDGQVEGKGYSVQIRDFADQLLALLLQLFAQSPTTMEDSLSNFSYRLLQNDLQLYRQSLQGYQVLSAYNPNSWYYHFLKGYALRNLGRLDEAISSYDKAIQINPDKYEAWYNRGNALKNLARYEEAIQSYDKALQIQPNLHLAWYNRGVALNNLGRYEEAIQSFDRALEFQPNYSDAWNDRGNALYNLRRFEEAISSYYRALEIQPDNYYQAWYNLGVVLDNLGRYEEAIKSYDKALQIKPDYSDAWNNQGIALRNLDKYEEAISCYYKAIEIQPYFHLAWYNQGNALSNLRKLEEAIKSYDKALQIKPDYSDAWYNKGIALGNLGRLEEAIDSFDKALQIKPDYHEAWYNRGIALRNLRKLEEAIDSFDKALEIKPDYHEAWYNRGIVLGTLGKLEKAIESFDKVLEIQPDYYLAWYNRGIALGNLGKLEKAIESFDKVLEIQPDFHLAWYRYNRGIGLFHLGRLEEEIDSFDKTLQIKPDDHQAWYVLAMLYALQKNITEAISHLCQAIKLNPEYLEMAKTDSDFDGIRDNEEFVKVINEF